MRYPESVEQSAEYLRIALRHMVEMHIPVTPNNYAVWYEYVSGGNKQLSHTIDNMIKSSKAFTPEVNERLFNLYILDEFGKSNMRVLFDIKNLLIQLAQKLNSSDEEFARHGMNLEGFSVQILDEVDNSGIRRIVGAIVAETKSMIEAGTLLRSQLDTTSHEVDALREALEKAQERARTDALTGLANRMAFETALKREISEAQINKAPLSLIFADIDHFKRVNDTYGHLVGDMMLRMSATMIKSFIKGRDTAARYGGEEFIVLLPQTPLEGAKILAENIRAYFEKRKWRQKETGKPIGTITISLGVAQFRDGEDASELLGRADQALYRSKSQGRNRVTGEEALF